MLYSYIVYVVQVSWVECRDNYFNCCLCPSSVTRLRNYKYNPTVERYNLTNIESRAADKVAGGVLDLNLALVLAIS